MGRNKKNDAKRHQIKVRVNDEELAELEKLADKLNVSKSECLRLLTIYGNHIVPDRE